MSRGDEPMSEVVQIEVIPSKERGLTQSKWLESYHSFSFGTYHNLKRLNFGTLCVFNEDIIKPKQGFPKHAHDNMEIVTIVLKGALKHQDNTGHKSVIKADEVQRMTAGSGIEHSEYNASSTEDVHLLQIWIYPRARDLTPTYEQKHFAPECFKNVFFPIVSGELSKSSLTMNQNATIFRGDFEEKQIIKHKPHSKYHGNYLFVIEGRVQVADQPLQKGDSAQISSLEEIEIKTIRPSKLLLIEVSIDTVL